MAKKSKKKMVSPKVSLTQSDKQAIHAELGVSPEDLTLSTPAWAYLAGGAIILLGAAAAVAIVRSGE